MSESRKPLAAPAIAKANFKPLKACATLEEAFQTSEFMERIAASVPHHVNASRMLRTFVTAVSKAPLLAQADVRSFVGACLTLSQVGLEPNTPLQHAHLIPFKNRVWNPATRKRDRESVEINVIFGYPGLLDLSFRTPKVTAVHADVVWPGDEFSFEYGTDAHVRHRPKGMRGENDSPVYAYMHAALSNGQAFEVMPYADVLRTRNRSQAFQAALSAKDEAGSKGWSVPKAWTEAPWVAHEVAMARKTVFRQGSKWLPRSVELATAIALDEAQERRARMDFGALMDQPTVDGKVDYLTAAADLANEADPEDGPPKNADTGAAFGLRQVPRQDETPPAKKAEGQAPQAFEAMLVDEVGEVVGSHTDPADFAAALVQAWRAASAGTKAQVLENNIDSIEEARTFPKAAGILARLDAVAEAKPAVVPVPAKDGKPSWSAYVKALRDALAAESRATFPTWIEAQREGVEAAPIAQRLLAIKAINEAATGFNSPLPAWIGEAVRARAKAPSEAAEGGAEQPATEGQADRPAPPGASPGAAAATSPADRERLDTEWVAAQQAALNILLETEPAAEAMALFDTMARSAPVQAAMSRLAGERPALFAAAEKAFETTFRALDDRLRASGESEGGPEA